jgi:hypothetical protein
LITSAAFSRDNETRTVGTCRFSYAVRGGFKVTHEDEAELAAYLYNPERMEERFRLFEAVTLPSSAKQTDQDFASLIITGKWFPAECLERLNELTAHVPQSQVRQFPPP